MAHPNLVVTGTAAIVLPIAFVLAPLRGELFVSRALWRGLSVLDYSRLSPGQVEDVCRRALGDASLRLAIRGPGRGELRDVDGMPLRVSADGLSAAITRIEHAGTSYAVIHDPSLARGYRQVVERVGAPGLHARRLHARLSRGRALPAAHRRERR